MEKSTTTFSPSKSININVDVTGDVKTKQQVQELRQLLQERMTEFGLLQTEWSKKESELRAQSEDLVSQLHEIQNQYLQEESAEKAQHLQALNELTKAHQEQMADLQAELDECLMSTDAPNEFEDIDNEIEELKEQLKEAENLQPTHSDNEDESCLLYTSPSPRDLSTSRMPSSA